MYKWFEDAGSNRPRWDVAITQRGLEVNAFISKYFSDPTRSVLLICGAGFDPRATSLATILSNETRGKLHGIFIRELRTETVEKLLEKADNNQRALQDTVPCSRILRFEMIDSNGSVVGGRHVVADLETIQWHEYTDVIVDISALSIGVSFPAIKFLLQDVYLLYPGLNIHVIVAHEPKMDQTIHPENLTEPQFVYNFNPASYSETSPVKLWLPQLRHGCSETLTDLNEFVDPDEVFPILPFPSQNPRLGDELLSEFKSIREAIRWRGDQRSVVYADEADPLDLYRSIFRLHQQRSPVFEDIGGSITVLSPIGSKVMALGALLAAIDLDQPVAYKEAIEYESSEDIGEKGSPDFIHIWLAGAPYEDEKP